jgi:hypothetical protein
MEETQEINEPDFDDIDYSCDDFDTGFGKMDLRTCEWN